MKIFLIDDDNLSSFLTKQWLINEGFCGEVEIYYSAEDALDKLYTCTENQMPNLIFLDLNMPVMDGWEFLDKLAPLQNCLLKKCRIYILTSSLDMADENRSRKYEIVSDFIHKPIKREDIKLINDEFEILFEKQSINK